jgi:hypothetical protein
MSREIENWLRSRARELQTPAETSSTTARQKPTTDVAQSKPKLYAKRKIWIIFAISLLLVIALVLLTLWLRNREPAFFPKEVRQSVAFDLYYPNEKKLPQGFALDRASISTSSQVVLYSVNYGNNQRIAFTIQKKPPEKKLKSFYDQQLSKARELTTDIGTASLATLNEQSFASLPTKGNSWIIVTAPKNINQDHFRQAIETLRP